MIMKGGWSYEVEGYQSWDWIMDINKGGCVHDKRDKMTQDVSQKKYQQRRTFGIEEH